MNSNSTTTTLESDAGESVREYAQHVAGEVRDRAGKALTAGDHYVRANPWPVVLSAAGIGLLVGLALASRHEPTARERYVDEPLDHARDVIYGLLAPVAARLQHQYGSVRSTVEDAADRLHDVDPARLVDPMQKHAGRFVRKLRFW